MDNNNNISIVIIEDDVALSEIFSDLLSREGYEVRKFHQGLAALESIRSNIPDLMLLDLNLPDISGDDFIVKLRWSNCLPPFIVITGHGDEKIAVKMMKTGARDYLVKDMNLLDILPIIVNRQIEELKRETQLKKIEREISNTRLLNRQITDSVNEGVIVYDLDIKILHWNPYMEVLTGKKSSEVIDHNPTKLFQHFETSGIYKNIKLALRGEKTEEVVFKYFKGNNTKRYAWCSDFTTAVYDSDGNIIGAIAVVKDITFQKRNSDIINARIHLLNFAETHSLSEVLEEVINIAESLTQSSIGFFHFVDGNRIILQSWSSRTKAIFCKAQGIGPHYPVEKAGVWADPIRIKKPVIHNDYKSLTNKKGLPEGHAEIVRELVVPIHRGNNIVSIIGVGNGEVDYNESDIEILTIFAEFAWDVVGHIKLIENLKSSNERFSVIARSTGQWVWEIDKNFLFTYSNDLVYTLLGLTPDELVNTLHFNDLVENIDKGSKQKHFLAKMENRKKIEDYTCFFSHKNGNQVIFKINASVVTNKYGDFIGYRGSANDITSLIKIENSLKESEEKYRHIFEKSPDSIAVIDQNGLLVDINRAFTDLSGYSKQDLIGTEIFNSNIFNRNNEIRLSIQINLNKEGYIEYKDINIKCKNNTEKTVQLSACTIKLHGLSHILLIIQDISEQKKYEEKLRILNRAVDQSPASIVVTDTNGTIIYVNRKFSEITKYSAEEAIGQNPRILKSGYNSRDEYTRLWDTILSGKEWQGEFYNMKKNGEFFWESAMISPIENEDGKITHFVAVKEDITEKVELERKMLSRIIETEEKERNRFSKDLHDGLGPMLSTTKLYFQWLHENDKSTKNELIFNNGIETINEAIESIREISNNLSPRTLSQFGIIPALKVFIDKINTTKKIKIKFESNLSDRFDKNLEIILYRIVTELINNTIKYAEASGIEIAIKYRPETNSILLIYCDNGKGFNYDESENNFLGSGLLNINQRVKTLNGKVNIKSFPGEGFKISVELPVAVNGGNINNMSVGNEE